MTRLADADLPDYFPSDLELRLQDRATFDMLHEIGEATNLLFALGHRTIQLAGEPSIDVAPLTEALLLGVEAYEVVVAPLLTDTYTGEEQKPVVANCVLGFVEDIKRPEDFMAKADYAEERLVADAPMLHGILHEIVSRHVNHDKVATDFALRGAAVLRAMHIFVDRKLVA